MPSNVVQALAKKYNTSVETVEKYFAVGKEEAKKQGFAETDEDFYPYVVGIVKRMLGGKNASASSSPVDVIGEKERIEAGFKKKLENIVYLSLKEEYPNLPEHVLRKSSQKGLIKLLANFSPVKKNDKKLTEFYIQDPSLSDPLNWNFVWKANSSNRVAVAWAVVRDKPYEITFSVYYPGSSGWRPEWNVFNNTRPAPILEIKIDQLNASPNGMRISTGANPVPPDVQSAAADACVKIVKNYLKQFGDSHFAFLIFYTPNYYNPSLTSFYKQTYEKLLKEISIFKPAEEIGKILNDNKYITSAAESIKSYFVIKNSKF